MDPTATIDPHPAVSTEGLRTACTSLAEALATGQGAADIARWTAGVRKSLRQLFEALEAHRAVAAGPDGTMAEVASLKPALVPRIELMEGELNDMLSRTTRIQHLVDEQAAFQEIDVELVGLEGAVLREMLQLYLLRATHLSYETAFQVEGGEEGAG